MAGSTKRIAIAGLTRGLGHAMLREFLARGHAVAGCGRSEALVEKLRLTFPAPTGWVNDEDTTRDYGCGDDAYPVFRTMLNSGQPRNDWDALLKEVRASAKRLAKSRP